MMFLIGTSGWSYDHWDGVLYPPGLPPRARLGVYTAHYRTVEINSTFYRWPAPRTFANWRHRLPEGFVMAVKAPRGLTHGARLYAPERWIERIVTGLHELRGRRGPLLVQLPPDQPRDLPRLDYFLARLPPWLQVACEFRHASWHDDETFSILERHNAAYCVMSGAGLPCVLRATSAMVYVRLHGPDRQYLYGGSYSETDLQWWAARLREWAAQGHTVHAYFNNDGAGNAVRDSTRLWQILST
jgi:uncharacterized protein YecE (DUF72 family)